MKKDYVQEDCRTQCPPADEDINVRLATGLRDVSHTMRSLYGGKGSQGRILIVLSESGTITQRELTQMLGIQPGSASEVIAKLENAGLVERVSSEADRRTTDVSLTEAGRRQAQAELELRQQRRQEMFSVLTEEEKRQLLALLEKISSHWDDHYAGHRGHHCGGSHCGHRHAGDAPGASRRG